MSEYKLEIKQIVNYPRCRIYRQFIRCLMSDRNIRTGGSSGLFYYTVLCSYANFRTSYRRIDGISYTVFPGEWICRLSELKDYLRLHTLKQTVEIMEKLQAEHYIKYNLLGRGRLVKFKIENWHLSNRVLEYNAPCQKDAGFFFLPVSVANELVGNGRCSEMDAVLDLWINTVYNDDEVKGSEVGPLVYMRNGTGRALVTYEELSLRWGISKATVGRYLNRLKANDYISTVSFQGTHGTAVYIKRYLSTMFEISDVMPDKQELAMSLNIDISVSDDVNDEEEMTPEITVSKMTDSVSKSTVKSICGGVAKILLLQGFACPKCKKIRYMLLPLSECKELNTNKSKPVNS